MDVNSNLWYYFSFQLLTLFLFIVA